MNFDRATLDRMYGYCLALCNDPGAACDLLQDALEKYLREPRPGVANPAGYICRTARNHFFDQQRRAGIAPFEPLDNPDLYAGTERALESAVIDQFTLEQLWPRFTPTEREALYLWAVEEMTAAEIADHLQQPRATILSRLRRARARVQADGDGRYRQGGRDD